MLETLKPKSRYKSIAGIGDKTIKFSANQAKEYYIESLNYLEKYLKKGHYNLNAML